MKSTNVKKPVVLVQLFMRTVNVNSLKVLEVKFNYHYTDYRIHCYEICMLKTK